MLHLIDVIYVFVLSVKYEDPQALGGLASALDVRQQNAGGVSTLKHVVQYRFSSDMKCGCCVIYMTDKSYCTSPSSALRHFLHVMVCNTVCSTVTFVLCAVILEL